MKPWRLLAETTTPDGGRLTLQEHDGDFYLRLDGRPLMTTRATASESKMAELACAGLGDGDAVGRVLIGGLGFGFTLRAVLDRVGEGVSVQVVELLEAVVGWNREFLGEVNGHLLDDPRVEVTLGDVHAALAGAATAVPESGFAAVLLDVDNGSTAMVHQPNGRLYRAKGLRLLRRALVPGGRAVIWSASRDEGFRDQLEAAGFEARAVGAKAYPAAKKDTHTLFVAERGDG